MPVSEYAIRAKKRAIRSRGLANLRRFCATQVGETATHHRASEASIANEAQLRAKQTVANWRYLSAVAADSRYAPTAMGNSHRHRIGLTFGLFLSACGGGSASDGPASSPPPCVTEVGDRSSLMIDDFEDGDRQLLQSGNRHGSWYTSNDGSGIQAPAPDPAGDMPFVLSTPGSPQSPEYALRTVGWGFTGWGALLSVNLNAPQKALCSYDVSALTGIRFQAKGTGKLRVTLGTRATTQVADGGDCTTDTCSDFGAAVVLSDDWAQVSVAFTDFTQPSWATPAAWEPTETIRLTYWVEQGDFDYWIDDVQFY